MRRPPEGWRIITLEEACSATRLGGNYECAESNNGTPVIKMGNLGRGRIQLGILERLPANADHRTADVLKRGDILFNTRNTLDLVGKVAMWRGELALAVFNSNILRIDFHEGRGFQNGFANLALNSHDAIRQLRAMATGTTSVAAIYWRDVRLLRLLRPPLPEQERITAVVDAWDIGLERLESLIAAKAKCKRGLMQQLLTGMKRFRNFDGEDWRRLALGDILTFEPRVITKPKGAFLAAGIRSHGKGVFLKPDFEADDIALDELFQLRTDDLVVNITFAWEGAVAIVPPGADGALVSHRFPTFTFKRSVSFPGYFRHVIRQKRFVHELGLVSPGGAGRNRVLSKSDFLRIRVELPSFEEQQRIDAVLNASDREIELLQKQLAALKEQKRGLMQKLLTGEVRVKVGDGGRRSEVSGRREELQEKKRNGKEHND